METIDRIFNASRSCAAPEAWDKLKLETCVSSGGPEDFPKVLEKYAAFLGLPDFLPELARLEWTINQAASPEATYRLPVSRLAVNPTLCLLRFSWKHLPEFLGSKDRGSCRHPEKGDESVLLWRHPVSGELMVCSAFDEDLLVLKIAVEDIEPVKAAAEGRVPVHVIDAAVERGIAKGLLLAPASKIRRNRSLFPSNAEIEESNLSASVFTLQWHITQACDLHCRHCYDRSHRDPIELKQAMALLDDFYGFCRDHNVRGQISFTGGNPFLHPHFPALYRAAAERGFGTAIMGNPVPARRLEELAAIRHPVFFQVSLEGLREHNDWIRGPGHFDRSLGFLDLLREFGFYSMVMLTLTKHNMAQVLPLAGILEDRADLFAFNRLSLVGEGARLELPSKDEFTLFLHAYADAASDNPALGLKDNLINVVLYRKGLQLFGGCTGYGCGAAFNFITVLPDGEAHACRKFPSPIGNAVRSGIAEVYSSEAARSYRAGCRACRSCAIRHSCGGCLASAYSLGLDPLTQKDPYCFID